MKRFPRKLSNEDASNSGCTCKVVKQPAGLEGGKAESLVNLMAAAVTLWSTTLLRHTRYAESVYKGLLI